MMRSKFLCGAALLGAATICATAGVQAQEINFWTINFSNQAANKALESIAQEFEAKHPGVDVVFTQRAVDEHKTALRVAAGSDTGPDIYFSWAGLGLGGEYVQAGMSAPLDDYYKKYNWKDELLPTAAAFADDFAEGMHGVPFTFKGEALYYNKTLFEKAGITKEPETYEELLAAAGALKEQGIPAITFGGTVNWHVMRLMDVILETKCGAQTHDDLMAMKANWSTTPCAADSFAELKTWSDNYFLKPFMGISQQQSFSLFVAGRAAMMLEGNWLVQQLSEASDLNNYGLFPFPTGTKRLYGFAEYNYVSSKSKNPDLAAEFLDYFISTDVQQRYLGTMATSSINSKVKYENQRPLEVEWTEIFGAYDQMFVNGDQAFPGNVTTEYFRVINEVASDNMEPKAAADALQSFIDNL